MAFKVKTAPGKIEVYHPAEKKRLVIKIRETVELVPRGRVALSLALSSFLSATALSHGGYVAAGVLGAMALFLTWAVAR